MNRPRVSGLWRVAVALIALLVMLPSPNPHAQAQQTTPARRVILIPGIVPDCWFVLVPFAANPIPCDPGPDYLYPSELWARDTFDLLITYLINEQGYSRSDLRYFNYASDWATNPAHRVAYAGADTRQHLAVSASNLENQIRSWGTENVQYDIIGYSLGGAVAAYWAGWQPAPDILKVVRSIITLDSPVNGMFATQSILGTWSQWYLDTGEWAGRDLQDAGEVAILLQSVNNIDIVTFSNENDDVVLTRSALLPGGCPAQFTPCSFRLQPKELGNHSEIVTDPQVFTRIGQVLRWDGPKWLSRNPTAAPPSAPPTAVRSFLVDLGNPSSEAEFGLEGWGSSQAPPINVYVAPSGDRTKRFQRLRQDNSIHFRPVVPGLDYRLTAEVEDGGCTDSFDLLVNGVPVYSFTGTRSPNVPRLHQITIPGNLVTSDQLRVTFRNTSPTSCGLAAVYNVRLETLSPSQ